MVNALAKIFIKDRNNVQDPAVRGAYGTLCSMLGIVLMLVALWIQFGKHGHDDTTRSSSRW